MDNLSIVFIVLFVIVLIVLIIILFIYLFKNNTNNYGIPENQYPDDNNTYTSSDYLNKLPNELDLDNLPELLNNTLRSIGINERYNFNMKYKNLKDKDILKLNGKYIGTQLRTTDNNIIIFLDDYILSKDKLVFKTIDFPTEYGDITILDQFIDDFNNISSSLRLDNTIKDVYIYARGCSMTLGLVIYFSLENTGKREALFEGFPGMINDPHNILQYLLRTNRNVFVNNINDPLIDYIQSSELYNGEYIEFDKVQSTLTITNLAIMSGYDCHNMLNYYE